MDHWIKEVYEMTTEPKTSGACSLVLSLNFQVVSIAKKDPNDANIWIVPFHIVHNTHN